MSDNNGQIQDFMFAMAVGGAITIVLFLVALAFI